MPRRLLKFATLFAALLCVAVGLEVTSVTTAATVHVRRNAYSPGSPLATYARGVQAMKGRRATDPTSWSYQAAMHGTYASPALPLWNQCQHGSFFFFSWHRMYVYYFERIVRKAACGSDVNCQNSFALPYWNYSDAASQRVMPSGFRVPAAATNPLWVAARNSAINSGGPLPPSAVSYSVAFTYTNFVSSLGSGLSFGGQRVPAPSHFASPHGRLESQPHDVVHVAIGGWMSDPNTAAQDPIFWLHHANIDRLWQRWLALGGGRANPSPTIDATWYSQTFEFFDENGTRVRLTGAQILNTASQLGYKYDDAPPVLPIFRPNWMAAEKAASPPDVLSTAAENGMDLGTEIARVPITIMQDAVPRLKRTFGEAGDEGRLILNIEGIEFDKYPDTYYEVYVNLLEGEAPDFTSESYAGNLAFFGLKPHEGHVADSRGVVHSLDLSGVSAALKDAGRWTDDKLTVTLVPQAPRTRGGGLSIPRGKKARFARITLTRG